MFKRNSPRSEISAHAYSHEGNMFRIYLFSSTESIIYNRRDYLFPVVSKWNLLLTYYTTLTRTFKG